MGNSSDVLLFFLRLKSWKRNIGPKQVFFPQLASWKKIKAHICRFRIWDWWNYLRKLFEEISFDKSFKHLVCILNFRLFNKIFATVLCALFFSLSLGFFALSSLILLERVQKLPNVGNFLKGRVTTSKYPTKVWVS